MRQQKPFARIPTRTNTTRIEGLKRVLTRGPCRPWGKQPLEPQPENQLEQVGDPIRESVELSVGTPVGLSVEITAGISVPIPVGISSRYQLGYPLISVTGVVWGEERPYYPTSFCIPASLNICFT